MSRSSTGTIWTIVAYSSLLVAPAFGQQLEREPRPIEESTPEPYLAANRVDFRTVLASPPAADSIWTPRISARWVNCSMSQRRVGIRLNLMTHGSISASMNLSVNPSTAGSLRR